MHQKNAISSEKFIIFRGEGLCALPLLQTHYPVGGYPCCKRPPKMTTLATVDVSLRVLSPEFGTKFHREVLPSLLDPPLCPQNFSHIYATVCSLIGVVADAERIPGTATTE